MLLALVYFLKKLTYIELYNYFIIKIGIFLQMNTNNCSGFLVYLSIIYYTENKQNLIQNTKGANIYEIKVF